MLQAKINLANAGDTLVLPAGECMVARCDLAQEPSRVGIDHLQITKAHGDGLNLIADGKQLLMPATARVMVTNTDFVANDRSGITFQRNVGFVTIVGNYFRNSGQDQDLDMEPSGGANDRGPYEVTIDHNLFERLLGKLR